ncbi:hypothetical protein B0H15DRAFT_798016 [Mycena belliarum]|uniref:Uncharacterized protein n=1 Tax=Mycena belliarum TaxID=1033014 RepID=A0AAD6XY34_9AGAR|nr:hypothetical protein B0H15DRAFT_798016 [Mycena belliae]
MAPTGPALIGRDPESQKKLGTDALQALWNNRRRPNGRRGPPVPPLVVAKGAIPRSEVASTAKKGKGSSGRSRTAPKNVSKYSSDIRCTECKRHPANCTCQGPQRKITDDRWYRVDPEAWWDFRAPPRRSLDQEQPTELDEAAEKEVRSAMEALTARLNEQRVATRAILYERAMRELAKERMERVLAELMEAVGAAAAEDDTQRILQNIQPGAENLPSLTVKHETVVKRKRMGGLQIWPNPDMVDVSKLTAGHRPGYISAYERIIAKIRARDDAVSLALKRAEALDQGEMTQGFKIWLNPDMVDVAKLRAGRPAGYVPAYDRIVARIKAREARQALLKRQRAGRRHTESKGGVLGKPAVLRVDAENLESVEARDAKAAKTARFEARVRYFYALGGTRERVRTNRANRPSSMWDDFPGPQRRSPAATRVRGGRYLTKKPEIPQIEDAQAFIRARRAERRKAAAAAPSARPRSSPPHDASFVGELESLGRAVETRWGPETADDLDDDDGGERYARFYQLCLDTCKEPERSRWIADLRAKDRALERDQQRVRDGAVDPPPLAGVYDPEWNAGRMARRRRWVRAARRQSVMAKEADAGTFTDYVGGSEDYIDVV